MSQTIDDPIPTGAPELDIPPQDYCCGGDVEQVSHQDVMDLEKTKQNEFLRGLRAFLTGSAIKFLYVILLILVLLYASDTILINAGLKSSSLLSNMFELLKYMLTILLGYTFANIDKNG